jgi:hypothetical protein
MKTVSTISMVIAAVFLEVSAPAQTITWNLPTTISDDSDVITNGVSVRAYMMATSGQTVTLNGVTFTSIEDQSSDTWSTVGGDIEGDFVPNGTQTNRWTSLSSDYQTLLQWALWGYTGTSITLTNLIPLELYEIQVWVCDPRSFSVNVTETISGSPTIALNADHETGSVGQFITGTFAATLSNVTLNLAGASWAVVNALQLRDMGPAGPTVAITEQPMDAGVLPGQTATFTVGAASSNGTTNYQWYSGASLLGGATNASYTTMPLTLSDNGMTFFCVVSSGTSSLTSRVATVTVTDISSAYSSAVLADDPVVYYRFEESGGSTAFDVSGNGNNGTYVNVSLGNASATAVLGSAAGFSQGAVVVPALGTNFTQLTMEVWLKPNSFSQDFNAVYLPDGWYPGCAGCEFDNGSLQFAFDGNNPDAVYASGFVTGQWQHVVVTYDSGAQTGVQAALFYLDGTLVSTQSFASTIPADLEAGDIGAWLYGSLQRYFDGLMDEFAIYGTVLSAERVATHFQAAGPLIAITNQPVAAQLLPGATATFAVGAVLYSAPASTQLFYQWQTNGINIAGATNASYTTPTLTTNFNGLTFCCVLSAAGALSQTSAPVTLTVLEPVLPPAALAWLSFNNTLNDQSGQAVLHNGTLINPNNQATFVNDVPNAAAGTSSLWLPGDGSYVDLANPTNLDVNSGQPFTIAAWVKTSSNGVVAAKSTSLWLSGAGGTHTTAFYINSAGNLVYDVYNVGGVNSAATVNNGLWNHLAVTYDGGTYRLYINGQTDGVGAFGGANEGANGEGAWNFTIGQTLNTAYPTPNGINGAFMGEISGVAFWDAALSPAQILDVLYSGMPKVAIDFTQQPADALAHPGNPVTFTVAAVAVGTTSPVHYQWQRNGVNVAGATNASYTTPTLTTADSGAAYCCVISAGGVAAASQAAYLTVIGSSAYAAAVLADDPVVYYRFEESGGSTAFDSSTNGFNGTYVNVSLGNPSYSEVLGSAAGFSQGAVVVPALGTNFTQLTMEVWLKPNSFSQDFNTVYLPDGWSPGCAGCEFDNGSLQFAFDGNNPNAVYASGFVTGQWQHVVVTYDSGAQTGVQAALFYLDGTLVSTQSFTSTIPADLEAGHIGAWLYGSLQRYFDGLMDEFAIYGTVLSASQILAHYQAAQAPSPPVLQYTRSGKQLILSWTAPGFVLQQNGNLANAQGWTDVPAGGTSPVSVTIGSGNLFFRLRTP